MSLDFSHVAVIITIIILITGITGISIISAGSCPPSPGAFDASALTLGSTRASREREARSRQDTRERRLEMEKRVTR